MSDKPKDPQAFLNDIMDRSSSKTEESAGENVSRETPPEDGFAGTPELDGSVKTLESKENHSDSEMPEKNKPSSAYIYLAVLFGAAFLMLLLAYFVQQRNNAAVLDDLRSTTASREELLENIKTLEEERDKLQDSLDRQRTHNDKLEQENKNLKEESDQHWESLIQMTTWYDNAHVLECLEQFNRSGDYLMSSVIVSSMDGMFNRKSPYKDLKYLTPAHEKRYMELREELFDKGGIMVIETRTGPDESDYVELPNIGPNIFDSNTLATAQNLWAVIRNYAIAPDFAAMQLADGYQADSGNLNQVNNGIFKESTVELFEEIKADLIAQGHLAEKDGVFTAVDPPELTQLD